MNFVVIEDDPIYLKFMLQYYSLSSIRHGLAMTHLEMHAREMTDFTRGDRNIYDYDVTFF